MAQEQAGGRPIIVILPVDVHLCKMISMVVELEGYAYRVTHDARATLDLVDGDDGTYIVLMDNMQVSGEARFIARLVFALPDLHRRVKVVGMMIHAHQGHFALDRFLALPFTVPVLFNAIEELSAELQAAH